jgi:hypothetical protein
MSDAGQEAPVPVEYLGVWKRTLLRASGVDDMTSQVYWLQTQSWHADIRVPAGRPTCAGTSSLDRLERHALLGLARQQGFAGITVVDGDICRWLRRYDFQPPTGANDVGRMVFATPDRVFEHGVEADYCEIWERLPGSAGSVRTVRFSTNPLAWWLEAGDFCMRVRPRRQGSLPVSPSLTALAQPLRDDALRDLLDFEISFGTRAGGDTWRVSLSTLPWKEGSTMQAPAGPAPTLQAASPA